MKRMSALVLSLIMVFSLIPTMAFATTQNEVPESHTRTTYQKYSVAPGIIEEDITSISNATGNQTKAYIATIDPSNTTVSILAGYKDYDSTGKWGMQSVRDQAKAYESKVGKKEGKTVVAAFNGDYFNMNNGAPLGALVMDGKIVNGSEAEAGYFAILKDGTPVLRDGSVPLDDCKEAVGSPLWLVRDNTICVGVDYDLMPRLSVGIKANGQIVIMEADGRQAPKSAGLSLYETAQYMLSQGCVNALYLDGGGSATFASKRAGENALTVKNSPSDGTERKVSSSILICSSAKGSGVFQEAVLEPQGLVYTPGSTIQFTATGVDSAGAKVDLPAGAKFALADSKFGTINETTGEFTANTTTGEAIVNLTTSDGKVVGSTYIQIQNPDKIVFANNEVSLDFGETSTLGMMATYNNQEVNYKDGDFEWTLSDQKDLNGDVVTDRTAGTFEGNIFTATADKKTIFATATCKVKGSEVSNTVKLNIGVQPTVVMDFEDFVDESGKVIPAKEYWSLNNNTQIVYDPSGGFITNVYDESHNRLGGQEVIDSNLIVGNYDRGSKGKGEIVDIASGYPVSKGNHALKLNYDFTNMATTELTENDQTVLVGNATEGACVGFSKETHITGNPTGIGMYVYAPEGTPDFWLRMRFVDGTGTMQTVDFAAGSQSGGIDWKGWKYCEAKLASENGPVPGPYTLLAGETIRLLYVHATGNGHHDTDGNLVPISQCKGSIYIDNLQFVYGSNTTDTREPNIYSVKANGTEIEADTVVTQNKGISFEFNANDIHDGYKYDGGVDFTTANVYIDGVNITNVKDAAGNDNPNPDIKTDPSKDAIFLYNQNLSNGEHSVKVTVRDFEGNEVEASREFVVDGTTQEIPTITIQPTADNAVLGEKIGLKIKCDELASLKDVTASIVLAQGFSTYTVEYAAGFEEGTAPVFNKDTNTVTVNAVKKDDITVNDNATVATIYVEIPVSTPADAKFTYKITKGAATVAKTDEDIKATFSSKRKELSVIAQYQLSVPTFVVGQQNTVVITDAGGNRVSKIGLYNESGTLLGTSDVKGRVKLLFNDVQKITIYACDSEGVRSFNKSLFIYPSQGNEDGTPSFITLNATADPGTSKNITWISNPAICSKAVAQVALKADYDKNGAAAFTDYEGTIKEVTFTASQTVAASNTVVNANAVEVTGLKPGKTYVYRVGDGDIWSDVYSFETTYPRTDTNFFIVGDTQANDTTTISKIVDTIAKGDYDFGIQTGDFVEAPQIFSNWESIMNAFGAKELKGVDMIHVTGNHEYEGDAGASIATRMFNIENNKRYSVEYGDVYVAVLGFDNSEEGAKADAEWLVEDAAKSNATWKIVTSHQPVYGTNAEDTTATAFSKYLPAALEEAGIDIMYSGHDHSYARTENVKGGVANPDGLPYCIVGSTGEKSYSVSTGKYKDFKFEIATNEGYDGVFLTVHTTDNKFEVTAYDQDGAIFDTYELTKESKTCPEQQHAYSINSDNMLVCDNCGYTTEVGEYTGLVKSAETGAIKYLNKGVFANDGWVTIGDDTYYFDQDGNALTGECTLDIKTKDFYGKEYTLQDVGYTFDKNGKYVKGSFVQEDVTDAKGNTTTITRYYVAGGVYAVHWNEIDGGMYYFKKTTNKATYNDGMMYTGDGVTMQKVQTVANNNNKYFIFGEDGHLVRGAFDTDDKGNVRYYWGNEYVTGDKTIGGIRYHFDETTGDLTPTKALEDCTITGLASAEYTGAKITPKITVKCDGTALVQGQDYTVSYTNNKAVGKATVTINPVTKAIRKDADGKNVIRNVTGFTGTVTKTFNIVPVKVSKVTAASTGCTSVKLTWTAQSGVDGYKVYRAESKNGSYKLIKTIADPTRTTFTNTGRTTGTTYYYVVKTYKVVDGKNYISTGNTIVKATPMPKTTRTFTAKAASYRAVTLTWTAQPGVTGYKVYRATTADGTYKLIKTIADPNATTLTNTNLETGKTYYYRVRAYVAVNGTNYIGKSVYRSATPTLGKVSVTSLKNTAASTVTVAWDKVTGADGYRVYRATSKSGDYTCLKTIENGATVSYVNKSAKNLTVGKTYYYKVRAYRMVDGKMVFGAFSTVKSVKIAK